MAQISIREYDVKKMFCEKIDQKYNGVQIRKHSDIEKLLEWKKYVIKPDMLFGKRGKRGLLGINLSKSECKTWLEKYFQKTENIDGVDGTLDVFLVEEIVDIKTEYYLSFAQSRDGDIVTFSPEGWIDIEENWETATSVTIPVTEELTEKSINSLLHNTSLLNPLPSKGKGTADSPLSSQERVRERCKEWELPKLISQLWDFYKNYGFISLEFNPIAQDSNWDFHMIDAVAKIDDQEEYLQKSNWKNLEIPNNYGFQENAGERYIRQLDNQTGASLKMKILNPDARIWTLFAGWGGSLVMTDTLWALGFSDEIWNYGECSWNPSREFTREYTKTLLGEMLRTPPGSPSIEGEANESLQGEWNKYLIIAGAIANFTHIDKTFAGIIDALKENIDEIHSQQVTILVRRGWINEKAGLKILQDACENLKIPAIITGSDTYMTEILKEIKL